jgi:ribosomal protein S18 acetylase RimI-like enzyme
MNNIIEIDFSSELNDYILHSFSEHAIETIGVDALSKKPIAFACYQNEKMVGVIVLRYFWGQMHIRNLVIEKEWRGKGIGRKLMFHALKYAKENNCQFAFVETMNFQAPEFYQKLGFEIDFIRHGYSENTSFYYLKKTL